MIGYRQAKRNMTTQSKTGYALVTGSSQGIGYALAQQCANHGINVLLVALPGQDLAQAAQKLQQAYPAIKVQSFGIDLTNGKAPEQVLQWCQQQGIMVQYLINNAGFGGIGPFQSYPYVYYEKMMQLNMQAVVLLTHAFLPHLRSFSKGYILNVGSMAGFFAMPYKIIYSASKSFVYSFSRSLREELRGTGVSISVVTPAGVPTNAITKARTEAMGFLGRATQTLPEQLAAQAFKAMLRRKAVVVPRFLNRFSLLLGIILPYGLRLRIVGSMFKVDDTEGKGKEMNQVPEHLKQQFK